MHGCNEAMFVFIEQESHLINRVHIYISSDPRVPFSFSQSDKGGGIDSCSFFTLVPPCVHLGLCDLKPGSRSLNPSKRQLLANTWYNVGTQNGLQSRGKMA